MHRSLLCLLRRQANATCFVKVNENGCFSRTCIQEVPKPSQSSFAIHKSIHTSVSLRSGDNKDENDAASAPISSKMRRNPLSTTEKEQLQTAAIGAAKSLPGDWTRTADDLMARLSVEIEKPAEDAEQELSPVQSSLLSTMKVGRSFEKSKTGTGGRGGPGSYTVQDKRMMRKRLARRNEVFASLYSLPRVGIFDAEKLKAEAEKVLEETDREENLWEAVSREKMQRSKGGLPRNGFEEMVQWTKGGRMWNFPVDNEEDMQEERQYKFHEHVFLSPHLDAFPSDGPLRRFMDLVILGLSKNPWISVPEKVEHIKWYADYFQQKQQLLESSIGDKAKMKMS